MYLPIQAPNLEGGLGLSLPLPKAPDFFQFSPLPSS